MERVSCLIIETDPEAIRHIDILGRSTGILELRWRSQSLEAASGLVRKYSPDLVLVGVGADPQPAVDAIQWLSKEFPSLYLCALSGQSDADLILRTMRAGAHDFLCKPVKEADLRATVEKVVKLRPATRPGGKGRGKIVSVFSNKGGMGTTTIAVNLADALVRFHGLSVAVVDLVLAHGDVTMFFNVRPSYSILDLARSAHKADFEFLQSLLVRHPSGVHILADPPMIEDAENISADQVQSVLLTLQSMFDYVVVDTPHLFDEKTLTALEMSDAILVISLLNLPALKNTQRCLELFGRIGLRDERVRLILSRYLPNEEISKESVEGILNVPIFFAVPNDYPTVISSINRGKLLQEVAPDKEVTRSFRQMADLLLSSRARPKPAEAPAKKSGFWEKFFATGGRRK